MEKELTNVSIQGKFREHYMWRQIIGAKRLKDKLGQQWA